MDHRERVVNAINHRKVDRVPFDFWAEKPAIDRLCSFRGTRDMSELENFDWPVPDELDYSGLGSDYSRYDDYA